MKFSLIVPVYKQEKTIKRDLQHILEVLSTLNMPYELIAVVDGNVDKSMSEAKKIKDSHVIVTGYKTNRGKGYAVRYGFARATGTMIGFIDAGGDLSPDAIPLYIDLFRWHNADIVIGSKRHPDSKVSYPQIRRFISWVYQIIIRILFHLNIRDSQVGIKLYRRQVLEKVLPRLLVKKFAFDIELLSVANYLGFTRIIEAPVSLSYKFNSTITSVSFWKIAFSTLRDTLAVYYRLYIRHYYDDTNVRLWRFDPELNFRINIG